MQILKQQASDKKQMQLPLPCLQLSKACNGSFSFVENMNGICDSGCAELAAQEGADAMFCLTDPSLFEVIGVRVAFSTRLGGVSASPYSSLNLGRFVGDEPSCVQRNMSIFLASCGMGEFEGKLINPVQVHGTKIVDVFKPPTSRHFDDECDAVVTTLKHVPVMLCYADCVPVIMVAPTGDFCVIHSGWRGTYDQIAYKALEHLSALSSCEPSSINVYIGPHIGKCCYEVDQELAQKFASCFGQGCVYTMDSKNHLDLEYCLRRSLNKAGANAKRIVSADMCTACNKEIFYSHRAQNGKTGRFGALCCRF